MRCVWPDATLTVGMMARVTLGHTGRNVAEPPSLVSVIFGLLLIGYAGAGGRGVVVAAVLRFMDINGAIYLDCSVRAVCVAVCANVDQTACGMGVMAEESG